MEFTRSRPYRKNDQAHIEQKNGAVVRRMVGCRPFDGLAATQALAHLYRSMHLFVNFFQPSFKLAEKMREGALIRKRYHAPMTPHQRLVADPRTSQARKDALDAQHGVPDPVSLFRDIRMAQQALIEIADAVPVAKPEVPPLSAFLDSLRIAWHSTGEVRPTAQPNPSKPRYRTVPDPLEAVSDTLTADPGVTGRQRLERLQADYPGVHSGNLIRTVQRRLKSWRREHARDRILSSSDTADMNAGLSGEALRWLSAPHLAGKPSAQVDVPADSIAFRLSDQ